MKKFFLGVLATCGILLSLSMAQQTQLAVLTPAQQAILARFELVQLSDGIGGTVEAIRVTSNLQVVDGSGDTIGPVNGLGNIIVGYNDLGATQGDVRTGSHNLIAGNRLSYTSYGTVLFGTNNSTVFPISSVLGGELNVPGSTNSVVVGGRQNVTTGLWSVAVGGQNNSASGNDSVSVGGQSNVANGTWSVLSGGSTRQAFGAHDWVSGSLFENN